ncbi:hypothetical protein SAMN04487818_10646 [Actinokineospora terrae]|uniref:Uncharacterized protein n=1 Tax=Actinokineospora terrae TaxID=155974 RepID=A0A1H9T388_9PSEU|nr:hypothetical protein SAMN04487818_10646 [Actinokineospora terrae]
MGFVFDGRIAVQQRQTPVSGSRWEPSPLGNDVPPVTIPVVPIQAGGPERGPRGEVRRVVVAAAVVAGVLVGGTAGVGIASVTIGSTDPTDPGTSQVVPGGTGPDGPGDLGGRSGAGGPGTRGGTGIGT